MKHIYQEEQFGENWFGYESFYKSLVDRSDDGANIVEIGSWKGKSAAYLAVEIINSNKKIKLYCVDTWMGSAEHQHDNILVQDGLYTLFLKNTEMLRDVIIPIRTTSIEASGLFEDNSLDACFIDGDHSYEAVRSDIQVWYPKVKNKGILSGHDYGGGWHGVTKACDESGLNIRTMDPSVWIHEINR